MSKSPDRRRSSVKVGFVENVEDFVQQEINKDQWSYAIEQSSTDVLRKFLKSEADREFSDLNHRMTLMRNEKKDIEAHLQSFQSEAEKLHNIADTYVQKKQEEEEHMKATQANEEVLGKSADAQKAEAKNAQDRKRDMMNDRNKELLACNDKNLEAVKADANKNKNGLGAFLLGKLACLINNDDQEDKWEKLQDDQFSSAGALQLAVRSADGTKLSQDWMENVRGEITGSDDDKEDHGLIFKKIISERDLNQNIPMFPYYRVLSKVWHFIAAARKMARHEAKMKNFEQERKQIQVKVTASQEKISALAAFDVIKAEALAIDQTEVAYFQKRLDAINSKINDTDKLLTRTNFADEFFA